MNTIPVTKRTKLKRLPDRGSFDRDVVNAIIDEAYFCHVGFLLDGQPFVIPTIHARIDDQVYFHGSAASRMLRTVRAEGVPVCLTVTLLDALVMARSAFHHSMNYRSVMLLGQAVQVTDPDEQMAALEAVVEHVIQGRWADTRWPTRSEMKQTMVLRLPIDEASAKMRAGMPKDDDEDMGLPHWAGLVPLRMVAGAPIPDPLQPADRPLPDYMKDLSR
jgi:nitroimidazol reductase NimA-like FMN-containing flavoprotein (pyridoxamine 5'-phosphate oxidase superfamily)